jgi:hypothetical protein
VSIEEHVKSGAAIDISDLIDLWPTMRIIDFNELARGPLLNGTSTSEVKALALRLSDGHALRRLRNYALYKLSR